MFGRSIFIFVFLLVCLGIGTVWIVETESGARILPRSYNVTSIAGVSRLYNKARYKVKDWWYAAQGKVESVSRKQEEITVDKQKVVKWQDENGVWHFEYQKPAAPAE